MMHYIHKTISKVLSHTENRKCHRAASPMAPHGMADFTLLFGDSQCEDNITGHYLTYYNLHTVDSAM